MQIKNIKPTSKGLLIGYNNNLAVGYFIFTDKWNFIHINNTKVNNLSLNTLVTSLLNINMIDNTEWIDCK